MWRKKGNDFPRKLAEDLNEIKKILFAFLYNNYRNIFPSDSENTTFLRTAVVLNELVLFDLSGEQVSFRNANAQFINDAKREAMRLAEFRKGVLSFLASEGGLYKSWGHPLADKWIAEAKNIDLEVHIPSSVEEVREEVNRCLSYYRTLSEKCRP
jgi:hypothetical protein